MSGAFVREGLVVKGLLIALYPGVVEEAVMSMLDRGREWKCTASVAREISSICHSSFLL